MAVQDILQPQGERPEWDKEYYENSFFLPTTPNVLEKPRKTPSKLTQPYQNTNLIRQLRTLTLDGAPQR